MSDDQTIHEILSAWRLKASSVSPLGTGLINQTWKVDSERGEFVLQCLNAIFPASVNHDVAAVTQHLARSLTNTPELIPTPDGQSCVERNRRHWRLMSFIPGRVLDHISEPVHASAAGAMLARFHAGLTDLKHEFTNPRRIHEPRRHLENLRRALAAHDSHEFHAPVADCAADIFRETALIPEIPDLPDQVVHGDPKINNFIFDDTGHAICMVDLDTVGPGSLLFELGDAFRSWCNPSGEDNSETRFDLNLFGHGFTGYVRELPQAVTRETWPAVVSATRMISLELAARFAADALEDSYFGWNSERFGSRSEHNLVRANGQLALAKSLAEHSATALSIVGEMADRFT